MSLNKYKNKRHFDTTPEPTGGKPSAKSHRFVVQKHHASHLHYDFRLEMQGVLKSWAVPKGPSMNPDDKRLAMMVEDHPWDYRNFEGIIPQGYGAGTVIVWDEGTYEPLELQSSKKENDKNLLHQLHQGSISFKLKGKKLKGIFSLVKTIARGDNAWLLIKKNDSFASKVDITKKDKSIISNLNLEEVKATSKTTWKSNREHNENIEQNQNEKITSPVALNLLSTANKKSIPEKVKPMLCTLTRKLPASKEYFYEVKWDGYRVMAIVNKGKVSLKSRNGLNYNKNYKLVADACLALGVNCILDGEIVVIDEQGKPDFNLLQKYNGANTIVYYVFDILWYQGYELKDLPIEKRKEILRSITETSEIIRYSESFEDGAALLEIMHSKKMEGIVAKRKGSKYEEDKRNKNWLKLPIEQKLEFVIGGWSESDSGTPFKSLLFGYYEGKKLIYQGHAGGGFKEKDKKDIFKKLKQIETRKNPFFNDVTSSTKTHWVKPELVAYIKFSDYTESGKIRKPAIFMGFRSDKLPGDVISEKIIKNESLKNDTDQKETQEKLNVHKEDLLENGANEKKFINSNWKEIDKETITSRETFLIEGSDLEITNVEKPVWSDVPKASVIRYYHSIAPFILPHLKDRPLSLHIKNKGVHNQGFYIKDMEGRQPKFASIYTTDRKHKKKDKANIINYLVCNNEPTLLYMINLGCVDINPWTSTTKDPLHPDYIIIDLDPSDKDFKKVIHATKAAKKVFDKHKLSAFPKTSGKTGMHLFIPCEGLTFPECRMIAEKICKEINIMLPDITTTEITVDKRGKKLYLDPNQNDEADTIAAPYSVRPASKPTVSTPLEWREITVKLNFTKFTIYNILERANKKGDLFKKVLDKKIAVKNKTRLLEILKDL